MNMLEALNVVIARGIIHHQETGEYAKDLCFSWLKELLPEEEASYLFLFIRQTAQDVGLKVP